MYACMHARVHVQRLHVVNHVVVGKSCSTVLYYVYACQSRKKNESGPQAGPGPPRAPSATQAGSALASVHAGGSTSRRPAPVPASAAASGASDSRVAPGTACAIGPALSLTDKVVVSRRKRPRGTNGTDATVVDNTTTTGTPSSLPSTASQTQLRRQPSIQHEPRRRRQYARVHPAGPGLKGWPRRLGRQV